MISIYISLGITSWVVQRWSNSFDSGRREITLIIHACIGKFLHTTGQAEIIDKVLENLEECGGLASNGRTFLQRAASHYYP